MDIVLNRYLRFEAPMSRMFYEVIDVLIRQFSVLVFAILMIASMEAGAAKPFCAPFSWCRLFAWPNVPCQDLLAHSGDDCASIASREDPDTIYPGDGASCQRRKQFHARIREYNVVLQNVVAEYKNRAVLPMSNIEYVDIFGVRFHASDINGGDCFHPSFAGHQLLSTEEYCRSSWGGGDSACTQ